MPERYGPWKTAHERFRRWTEDGTWARLKREAIAWAEAAGEFDWDAKADSTVVRAHRHAAGARKRGTVWLIRRYSKAWVAPSRCITRSG
jgi:transposase